MKRYSCPDCGAWVFYENLQCLGCGAALAYSVVEDAMLSLPNVECKTVSGSIGNTSYRHCSNRSRIGCNWIATATDAAGIHASGPQSHNGLCDCCRYTRVIAPLEEAANEQAWRRLEQAKRYLFHSLHALHLPIPDRRQQPDGGLGFEFLAQLPDQSPVITGHANGLITIDVAEADDVEREQKRISLHEPYRTLLGHLRHEVGHFYWEQLLANSRWLQDFRALFGDERADYAAALQQHYQLPDDGSWRSNFVSRYASAHPWEDWAETWAHYLHINDALDTAAHWRIGLADAVEGIKPVTMVATVTDDEFRDRIVRQWLPLCQYLNTTCRSLGESDAYPFILPPPVVDKLLLVHRVVRACWSQNDSRHFVSDPLRR